MMRNEYDNSMAIVKQELNSTYRNIDCVLDYLLTSAKPASRVDVLIEDFSFDLSSNKICILYS